MASLFTLPDQIPLNAGVVLPGATLAFTLSASSTPQNIYQDSALTTPHTNPVTADGTGDFPAIYLDPSLPAYRVVLKKQDGTTLKTWDGVPSNQNTSQTFRLKYTAPALIFEETDATANNGKWRINVDAQKLTIDIGNDAESVWVNVATLTRLGTIPLSFDFSGQLLTVSGQNVVTYAANTTFTGTLTGMTTVTLSSVNYFVQGGIVVMKVNAGFTGVSNTTALTMTGVPGIAQAVTSAKIVPCYLLDNGTLKAGTASIGLSGTITFGLGSDGTTPFTASGVKGFPPGFTLMFTQ